MSCPVQSKLFLTLSLFSDFETVLPVNPVKPVKTTSIRKRSPVVPKCPVPPQPLSKMPKDVLDKFCRQMLNPFIPQEPDQGPG